jgi:hypothetical protein
LRWLQGSSDMVTPFGSADVAPGRYNLGGHQFARLVTETAEQQRV